MKWISISGTLCLLQGTGGWRPGGIVAIDRCRPGQRHSGYRSTSLWGGQTRAVHTLIARRHAPGWGRGAGGPASPISGRPCRSNGWVEQHSERWWITKIRHPRGSNLTSATSCCPSRPARSAPLPKETLIQCADSPFSHPCRYRRTRPHRPILYQNHHTTRLRPRHGQSPDGSYG